ncbi:MAG TPA: triose-phosphate isomerase [Candidatus Margulisiibacteriota bacterium]|nr:triose-phosphate isomerase [Candidatus Margulisiibacteriota bacterium]
MSPQRLPLIAGNWKMHGTRSEAAALAEGIKAAVGGVTGREVLVAPPYTALETVARVLSGSKVLLAAQDVHPEPKGAFTGEVSALMLHDAGCTHVIIGHSERRQFFGETDETVAQKTAGAQAHGLVPIVCIGETLAQREAGEALAVIDRQLRRGLLGRDAAAIRALVIAYEPVWAIGTGKVATPGQAQEVHAFIRRTLAELGGRDVADTCRVLYGGSVKPDNIDELMRQADIDGALVGGASLQVESFVRIAKFVA